MGRPDRDRLADHPHRLRMTPAPLTAQPRKTHWPWESPPHPATRDDTNTPRQQQNPTREHAEAQLPHHHPRRKIEAKTRGDLLPDLQGHRAVLGKVTQRIHDYLVSVEADLLAGKVNSDIFQRAQLYINEALRKYAPDALNKFVASQESLSAGTPEDFAHALTSCRRLIKALADAVYPARAEEVEGIDGVLRSMTDDKYKNRLTEYVRSNVEGKRHKQTVVQIVSDLSNRLNALDGLASKGVHDDVTQAEAETCVMWTYLLAGDIVRITDGTSALLVEGVTAP